MSRISDAWKVLTGQTTARTQRAQTTAVSVKVDDSAGWENVFPAPGDRPWGDVYADLQDSLEAWRKNFMVRRIVNLTRSYAVGSGIAISSSIPEIDDFIADFWSHPKNEIERRLGPISDQLCRDGELFPVLFTNPVDGMSYLRFKTARQIREVRTEEGDYETELYYVENSVAREPEEWVSPNHPTAFPDEYEPGSSLPPIMMHWAVNKPIDGTRGESDLTPILPWALRYSEWLKDRVRLNRVRTRQGVLDIEVADDTQVETKKQQLRGTNPLEAGIYVHGPGETVRLHNLEIDSAEAAEDGKVLRLAIATGTNLALHYLGEGEGTNYATAKEMGEPTARFFADRQQDIIWFLQDLVRNAYRRYCLVNNLPYPEDLRFQITVNEVARADNMSLATAALSVVRALAIASERAWIDDETALSLALKFAGETLPVERIRQILAMARAEHSAEAADVKDQIVSEHAPKQQPSPKTEPVETQDPTEDEGGEHIDDETTQTLD